MERERSALDKALGMLVSSLQHEESQVAGGESWEQARAARESIENLMWAFRQTDNLMAAARGVTLAELIGAEWLSQHPAIVQALEVAQAEIDAVTSNNSFKPKPLRGSA